MSSVSKAEERRRKILARQKDRLAFATGVVETLNTPNTTEGDGESVRKEEGEAAALREEATLNRSMEVEESLLESKEVVGVASDVGTGEVSSFEDLMSMARMSGPMPNFGGVGTDDSPADLNVLMNMMGPLQSMLPVESTETEASRRITAVSNIPTVPTWLRRLLLVVIAICIVFAKDVFKTVGTMSGVTSFLLLQLAVVLPRILDLYARRSNGVIQLISGVSSELSRIYRDGLIYFFVFFLAVRLQQVVLGMQA